MDDIMNKLQNVLNDEESINQIKELANMLTAQMPESVKNEGPQTAAANASDSSGSADLSKLLSGLMQGSQSAAEPPPQNPFGGFDAAKLMQLGQIMQNAGKSDKNIDLLLALRPLLRKENQSKIDRLIKIFKLFAIYPALKDSGLLGGDLFGLL